MSPSVHDSSPRSSFHQSTFHKTLGFVTAMAGIIWLGGSIVRAAIAFDMFVPGTLTFKDASLLTNEAMTQTIRLFSITAFYTMLAYGVFILAGVALWLAYRQHWRAHGSLFVAGILFALYIPVEIVLMIHDIKLVQLVQYDGLSAAKLDVALLESGKQLVAKRISALNGIPLVAVFGYITAVCVLVWQPLRQAANASKDAVAEAETA